MNMEGKVAGPAIGLIVIGAFGALCTVPSFFVGLIDLEAFREHLSQLPPEARELFEQIDVGEALNAATSATRVSMNVLVLVANLFITWAGVRMLSMKSWTAAIVASSLVMVTGVLQCITSCVLQCCCFPIGIGFGIWSLIVLLDPNVKQAFEAKAAA